MPLSIEIKVIPASGKQKCILEGENSLKCYLKSSPERGKANTELIRFLSKKLKIPQFRIKIMSGATLRRKSIKIYEEIEFEEVCEKLGIT
jgi:hypothetical protein